MAGVNERWEKFDDLGAEQVQKNLADGIYGEDNKRAARAWLEHRASEASAASQTASLSLAREAQREASRAAEAAARQALAAERQALAAESANRRATIAIAISIASIAVTIIIAIVGFRYAGGR